MDRDQMQQALEALHPASFAWAMTCCGFDRARAEDVLQTAYLKVLDGRAVFSGRSSLKTWFFAVLRNTAAQQGRVSRLRRLFPISETVPTPEARVDHQQRQAEVRHALARLSTRQREVLDLVFFHELTVEQAAEVMAVGVGSARVHYARGKKAMSRHLRGSR